MLHEHITTVGAELPTIAPCLRCKAPCGSLVISRDADTVQEFHLAFTSSLDAVTLLLQKFDLPKQSSARQADIQGLKQTCEDQSRHLGTEAGMWGPQQIPGGLKQT